MKTAAYLKKIWHLSEVRLVTCTLGIYIFYFLYSVVQEHIALARYGPNQERFDAYFFILFAQCACNAAMAVLGCWFMDGKKPWHVDTWKPIVTWKYAIVSASYMLAMYLSNAALLYVPYPTQVLMKSCKMVPVMFLGVLVLRRRYQWSEYLTVLLITAGIILFQNVGGTVFRLGLGELMLFVSLLLDGLTGTLQESILHGSRPSSSELMLALNMWAMLILVFVLGGTGEGARAAALIAETPRALADVLVFGGASALGQNFVFLTLAYFGALALAAVTTTRKFFSILLSVSLYGHRLGAQQWLGVAAVFAGLSLEIHHKYAHTRAKRAAAHAAALASDGGRGRGALTESGLPSSSR